RAVLCKAVVIPELLTSILEDRALTSCAWEASIKRTQEAPLACRSAEIWVAVSRFVCPKVPGASVTRDENKDGIPAAEIVCTGIREAVSGPSLSYTVQTFPIPQTQ